MPKLKPNNNEIARRNARAEIEACVIRGGLSKEQISAACGFTVNTYYNRRERPQDWTLGQLQTLAKKTGMTPLQAASIILGRPVTASEVK